MTSHDLKVITIACAAAILLASIAWQPQDVFLTVPRGSLPSAQELEPAPPARLFTERNQINLEVPWEMPLKDLIGLYQLEQSRDEIIEQLGGPRADDDTRLEEGRALHFHLMPLIR
jgi:hypothetical protein